MLATQAPFSQYFDKNGDPLDAGFAYFGQPNQNPETAPMTVYWDFAGTQPVAQPARTLAGYIVRNGTPARVYAEGAYSVTVRNRKGEPVYYAATSTDFSNQPVNRATVTATNGQTLVTLPFAYTRGNNSLQVFVNGLMVRGSGIDYTETTTTSITFANGLSAGDEVELMGGVLLNPANAIGMVSDTALAADDGSSLVGDTLPIAPSSPTYLQTLSQILQGERVSLFRFMPTMTQAKLDLLRIGNDTTDYTTAVQTAFDAAEVNAYEMYVPKVAKQIRLTNTIEARFPITVTGTGGAPYIGAGGPKNLIGMGSYFLLDHLGIGFNLESTNPSSGYRFSGICTRRNQPSPTPGWVPLTADYDFRCGRVDATFDDILLLNPTKGILATTDDYSRLEIRRLRGQAMQKLIKIEKAYDAVYLSDIRQWPFWYDQGGMGNPIEDYQLANLDVLQMERCDSPFIVNLFGIFARSLIRLSETAAGSTQKIRLVNADADRGLYGLWVDSSNTTGPSGQFGNLTHQGETGLAGSRGIFVDASGSDLQFGSFRTARSGLQSVLVQGAGNNRLSFGELQAKNYGVDSVGINAVEVGANHRVLIDRPNIAVIASRNKYNGAGVIVTPESRAYTPAVSAFTGALTTASATGSYVILSETDIEVFFDLLITTNGTGATILQVSLPTGFACVAGKNFAGYGRERAVTGRGVSVSVTSTATVAQLQYANDNSYPGADNVRIAGSVRYSYA